MDTSRDKQTTGDEAMPQSQIDFSDFPASTVNRYMVMNGLDLDYPPTSLVRDPRTEGLVNMTPPDPVLNAAVAEGRDTGEAHRARARYNDQARPAADLQTDIFDRSTVDAYHAAIATEHYANMPPLKESDMIIGFLYRCRTKDSVLKIV
ncbi:hypothetical protein MCUN1_001594 [Malassezia cuniculi]|uniref:Uncharacterized protein n=1 Tax=Malassezia cuniculi TaxID=948313 RepID=A0AAF0EQX8_9BASI|nr:hypothetical protein MCUN1_001594 [Malassezia cuniculi]